MKCIAILKPWEVILSEREIPEPDSGEILIQVMQPGAKKRDDPSIWRACGGKEPGSGSLQNLPERVDPAFFFHIRVEFLPGGGAAPDPAGFDRTVDLTSLTFERNIKSIRNELRPRS